MPLMTETLPVFNSRLSIGATPPFNDTDMTFFEPYCKLLFLLYACSLVLFLPVYLLSAINYFYLIFEFVMTPSSGSVTCKVYKLLL